MVFPEKPLTKDQKLVIHGTNITVRIDTEIAAIQKTLDESVTRRQELEKELAKINANVAALCARKDLLKSVLEALSW